MLTSQGSLRCLGCGAVDGTSAELTVMGFMRVLRKFERLHNKCAIKAGMDRAAKESVMVIARAKAHEML